MTIVIHLDSRKEVKRCKGMTCITQGGTVKAPLRFHVRDKKHPRSNV